jgi:hypothetical protein
VVEPQVEIVEAELGQHVGRRGADLGFDHRGRRPDGVDVALVELAEPALGRTVGPPHRLDLIALEEARQLRLVMGDDAGQRHRQVVAQRQVGLARWPRARRASGS